MEVSPFPVPFFDDRRPLDLARLRRESGNYWRRGWKKELVYHSERNPGEFGFLPKRAKAPPCLRHRGESGGAMRLRPGRAAAPVPHRRTRPRRYCNALAWLRKRWPRNWIWPPNSRANSCWRREARWRETPCCRAHQLAEGRLQGNRCGQMHKVTRSERKPRCLAPPRPRVIHSWTRVIPPPARAKAKLASRGAGSIFVAGSSK